MAKRPTSWPKPIHWKPGGRSCTQTPSVAHRSASRSPTIVARVTTIAGSPKPATSTPLSAPSEAPAARAPAAAIGMASPALASIPATTAQIANCEPIEMSICRARITSVIPTAATSTGAAPTRTSRMLAPW